MRYYLLLNLSTILWKIFGDAIVWRPWSQTRFGTATSSIRSGSR